MKSMLLKLGNWEPSQHFLKTEVTEETCVDVFDHRTFRYQADFDPVYPANKGLCTFKFLNISVLRVHCFFIQKALHIFLEMTSLVETT